MSNLPDYIKDVCKIGQGAACCKYLLVGSKGFECGKIDEEMKLIIDVNWVKNRHVAQGDNCPGVKDFETAKLPEP